MKQIEQKSQILRFATVLLFALFSLTASGQYYQMKVRTLDGLITPFNVDSVESVYFELVESDDNGNDEGEKSVTGSVTDITSYSAKISSWANIPENYPTDSKVGIIYTTEGAPSKNNGIQRIVDIHSLHDGEYAISLTNLDASTTYYYRSFVYLGGIWTYGNIMSFVTSPLEEIEVNYSADITKITCYSAEFTGNFGNFCYSTDPNPTPYNNINNTKTISYDGNGISRFILRSLAGSTTYYYRWYKMVGNNYVYGPVYSFTTKKDDVVITGDIDSTSSSIVKSTLKIGGGWSSLELGVCYGTNELPTVKDEKVSTDEIDNENNFIVTLKLANIPNGKVYYRTYVIIDNVAHYGEVKSFIRKKMGYLNGFEFVDLGLSVKWATCNVGATAPEDYGDYFAWGEIEPYYESGYAQTESPIWKADKSTGYSWSSYKFCKGSYKSITKYALENDYTYEKSTDRKTYLDLEDDVAHVMWGRDWRMPTYKEVYELINNCTWTWTTLNGVNGYIGTSKITGYTNCSIFLPAAGNRISDNSGLYSDIIGVGSWCSYWTSEYVQRDLDEGLHTYVAWSFGFDNNTNGRVKKSSRCYGFSVRPVCP